MPLRGNRYDVVAYCGGTQPGKRVGLGLLHGEEDFEFGITFTVKYIGTQDVAQPHNRVEIVAAMRRIRFECKARGIKKQKINLTVSVKGVRVVLFRRNRKKYQTENLPILEHPIYRIFYVSHDSHDLLIFSYISRESTTNQFRCNVFKAFKKSHAVDVVRTIGQAFDICHRTAVEAELNDQQKTTKDDDDSDRAAQHADTCQGNGPCALVACQNSLEQAQTSLDSGHSTGSEDVIQSAQRVLDAANFKPSSITVTAFKTVGTITSPMAPLSLALTDDFSTGGETLSSQRQIQLLLQRQKELQSQQMHCLLSQMQLLKDQLAAETDARIDAQSRIHQLFGQNQELLEHINLLVQRLVQLEAPRASITQSEIPQYTTIPHLPAFSVTSSAEHPAYSAGAFTLPRSIQSPSNQVAVSVQNVSPDSGHREMSSDSLSASNNTDARLSLRSWHTPSSNQTLHAMSAFGVKQSLVTVASAKSLEISKIAKDNFHANQCNPCPHGDNSMIQDEKILCEDSIKQSLKEQLNPNPLSSVDSTRPNSSVMILQTQCSYNSRLTSEIVSSSGPTQPEDTSQNLSDPVMTRESAYFNDIVDNFTASANGNDANLLQCNSVVKAPVSFRGGDGNVGVVESDVTGSVVSGNEATSNNFCDNVWSQLSTISLHSTKSMVRDSSLDHVTVNSLPFGLSNQLTNLNG